MHLHNVHTLTQTHSRLFERQFVSCAPFAVVYFRLPHFRSQIKKHIIVYAPKRFCEYSSFSGVSKTCAFKHCTQTRLFCYSLASRTETLCTLVWCFSLLHCSSFSLLSHHIYFSFKRHIKGQKQKQDKYSSASEMDNDPLH